MTYLITGHTGFKGAWYGRMLAEMGIKISGVSLDPEPGSMFTKINSNQYFENDFRADIRELDSLRNIFSICKPEIVIHLAAQALVGRSYDAPMETFQTNVAGTANLLQCVSESTTVKTCLIVTTDKVYQSKENSQKGFTEFDPLGFRDPYSSSKAMADIWAQSIAKTSNQVKVLIARAGNVIGSGDVSKNRLIPDLIRSWSVGDVAKIRNLKAIRPWQHVSDCISGYQLLIEKASELETGSAWNFSPSFADHVPVGKVVEIASKYWGEGSKWVATSDQSFPETEKLILDSTKARELLNWQPRMNLESGIEEAILGWQGN